MRSFDTVHPAVTPGLFIATGLCSSERSAPQIFTFCLLTAPFVRKNAFIRIFLISSQSVNLGVMNSALQMVGVSPHHSQSGPEEFAACKQTRREHRTKCGVFLKEKALPCIQHYEYWKNFWKSSVTCLTVSSAVLTCPSPPPWPRFPVFKKKSLHVRIS